MRDILFRGKRIDNGAWVEGYLQQINSKDAIFSLICDPLYEFTCYENAVCGNVQAIGFAVIPETVGQYTGSTDKNGKKIFEGDIVKWDGTEISIIRYCEGVYRLCNKKGYYGVSLHNHFSYVEVIGNIHDNPELLEVDA